MSRKRIDYNVGDIVGDLTIIKEAPADNHGNRCWLCRCSCGNYVIKKSETMKRIDSRGYINSCGCRRNFKKIKNTVDLSQLLV